MPKIFIEMKIVEEPSLNYGKLLRIRSAEYVGNWSVMLEFSDGHKIKVDFLSFLKNGSHPDLQKFLDESEFKSFTLEIGNLCWNDFEMIFPLSDLNKGKI